MNNSDKTPLLEYINGIINLLKESIEKQLDTNNADIKELHKAVSALSIQVEKNKDQLSLIMVTIDKHQDDYKELLKEVNPEINFDKVKNVFLNHNNSYSHSRHMSKRDCRAAGLNIVDLEANQNLQDAVLSLHHCYMILFDKFLISKVVENNIGGRYIQNYTPKG